VVRKAIHLVFAVRGCGNMTQADDDLLKQEVQAKVTGACALEPADVAEVLLLCVPGQPTQHPRRSLLLRRRTDRAAAAGGAGARPPSLLLAATLVLRNETGDSLLTESLRDINAAIASRALAFSVVVDGVASTVVVTEPAAKETVHTAAGVARASATAARSRGGSANSTTTPRGVLEESGGAQATDPAEGKSGGGAAMVVVVVACAVALTLLLVVCPLFWWLQNKAPAGRVAPAPAAAATGAPIEMIPIGAIVLGGRDHEHEPCTDKSELGPRKAWCHGDARQADASTVHGSGTAPEARGPSLPNVSGRAPHRSRPDLAHPGRSEGS